jgi:hypothetical protein
MNVRKKREDKGALSEAERLLSEAGGLISKHVLPCHPYNKKTHGQ